MRIDENTPGRIPPIVEKVSGSGPWLVRVRRRPIPYSPPGRSPAALAAVQAMNEQARRADASRERNGPGGWPD